MLEERQWLQAGEPGPAPSGQEAGGPTTAAVEERQGRRED